MSKVRIHRRPILLASVISATLGTVLGLWIWMSNDHRGEPNDLTDQLTESRASQLATKNPTPEAFSSQPKSQSSHKKSNRAAQDLSSRESWEKFQAEFGPGLVPEFSKDGRFVSAQGALKRGAFGPSGFDPADPKQVIARARKVIDGARNLLGLREDWPLENTVVRNGRLSAQVYLNQTYNGIEVAPGGNVKLDLGPHGELLAFYSDYASDIHVTNQWNLTPDQARLGIPSTLLKDLDISSRLSGGALDGGRKVIWITSANEARFAYRFSRGGYEIIIDAETGGVLSTRNRRHN